MRERLKSPPAEEIVRYLIGPRLHGDAEALFPLMDRVNRAHLVMLAERGILAAPAAGAIARGLARIAAQGLGAITLDPHKEDLYFNVEAALIAEIGPEVGGQLHTGRSRNDLYATLQRMKLRAVALDITDRTLGVVQRLLDLADREAETVMTGYTHMQPGQPVTVGHYLAGVAQALQRDAQRLLDVWHRINLSPLGAGGLATTGFPIDRSRTAALLGFDGVIVNSLDAVGSRDYVADLLYAFATTAITISRLAHDIHVWYTFEFGFIDIDDSIAGTSSIMPQKKNPSPIEHLKAKAAHPIGALVSALAAMKTTPFTHGREVGNESVASFGQARGEMEATLALTDLVLRGLRFRAAAMLDDARRNYCTLTELADTLVRDRGLSFRVAHEVVGALARAANEQGLAGSHAISPVLVNKVAQDVTGRALDLTETDLAAALDPRFNVEQRRVAGGPAPDAVRAAIAESRVALAEKRAVVAARHAALEAADRTLDAAAAQLAS
jgi:argininosuccinate lyase